MEQQNLLRPVLCLAERLTLAQCRDTSLPTSWASNVPGMVSPAGPHIPGIHNGGISLEEASVGFYSHEPLAIVHSTDLQPLSTSTAAIHARPQPCEA